MHALAMLGELMTIRHSPRTSATSSTAAVLSALSVGLDHLLPRQKLLPLLQRHECKAPQRRVWLSRHDAACVEAGTMPAEMSCVSFAAPLNISREASMAFLRSTGASGPGERARTAFTSFSTMLPKASVRSRAAADVGDDTHVADVACIRLEPLRLLGHPGDALPLAPDLVHGACANTETIS